MQDSDTLEKATAMSSSRMKQKIYPINANESAWIKTQLENAAKFVEGFSPDDAEEALTLSALDRAFASWISSGPMDVDLINAVINYVGIAFGQALVDGMGLQWVIAIDEHGSDLAVYGLPGRGDVLVYPANFVAKRWERHEASFLETAYQQIGHDVRAIFRKWRDSSDS